jgi:protein SCO1/2
MWLSKQVIWRWVIVGLLFLGGIFWAYNIILESRPQRLLLPVYGIPNPDGSDHKVAGFSLVNQDGNIVTEKNFKDKIYVADFFFTSCQGICPLMGDQMERIAAAFKDNSKILILSHTVKPEEDSVSVLKQYAQSRNADESKWFFVTGKKSVIEDLARNSYFVAELGDTTNTDFVHTQFFALVDPQKRLRGFYDGTDSVEVNKLIEDIGTLLKEE